MDLKLTKIILSSEIEKVQSSMNVIIDEQPDRLELLNKLERVRNDLESVQIELNLMIKKYAKRTS